MKKRAVVTGATGLVGTELVKLLCDQSNYEEIIVVARRTPPFNHDRLTFLHTDFENFENLQIQLDAHDHFCCLGTTMKVAGSKEKFKKVDFYLPIQHASIAQKGDFFERFLIVTAQGSSTKSVFFYNRVKGELEQKLKAMNMKELHVFQPSFLTGDRAEVRIGEKIALPLVNALKYIPSKATMHLSIHAHTVAKAMVKVANSEHESRNNTYLPQDMERLAKA